MPINNGEPVVFNGKRVQNLRDLGNGRYMIRREIDGRAHKEIFLADIVSAAVDYRDQVCNSQGERRIAVRRDISLSDFVRKELEPAARAAGKPGPDTINLHMTRFRVNIEPVLGRVALYKITAKNCSDIYNDMRQVGYLAPAQNGKKLRKKYSPNTVSQTEAAFMWILGAAASSDFGYVVENEAAKVKLAKPMSQTKIQAIGFRGEVYFQEGELEKTLAEMTKRPIVWNATFFGRMTGLRIREVLGMQLKHQRFLQHKILVEQQLTATATAKAGYGLRPLKNGRDGSKVRLINMPAPLERQLLDVYIPWLAEQGLVDPNDPEAFLFPSRRTPGGYCPSALGAAFKKARLAAGIERPGITFHSLRHTFATQMIERGLNEKFTKRDLARHLGHSVGVLEAVYEHHLGTDEKDEGFQEATASGAFAL